MSDSDFTPDQYELARQHMESTGKQRSGCPERLRLSEFSANLLASAAGGKLAIVVPGFTTN